MNNKRHFGLIMAGGQGTRFWPWSTAEKPKQFLSIVGEEPLITQTFNRLKKCMNAEDIFVVADRRYLGLIQECIPGFKEENFIDEPCPRNTAPCLMLANIFLSRIDEDANVAVAAADHFIPDPDIYAEQIKDTLNMADNRCIITSGIQPTEPHTGYGYLKFDSSRITAQGNTQFFQLEEFKEKPPLELAKQYLEQGNYFWNSGMFFYNLKHFKSFLKEYNSYYHEQYQLLEQHYDDREEFVRIFSEIKPDSIDYALMEKVKEVRMFKADFSWNDVGAWSSVYELKEKDRHGNVTQKENHIMVDATNSMIFSTGDKPVAVIGLDNVVVIDTGNGILIADQAQLQKVKTVTQALKK